MWEKVDLIRYRDHQCVRCDEKTDAKKGVCIYQGAREKKVRSRNKDETEPDRRHQKKLE